MDILGDEDTALDWLAEKHGIDPEISVNEKLWGDKAQPWPFSALTGAESALDTLRRLNSTTPRLFAMIQ